MKSPLRYQVTQYDCGPTTMTNAILYLFEREEIPPDLVRHIGLCTLDSYDRNGHCGMCGTTGAAMRYFGTWLNELRFAGLLPAESMYMEKEEVARIFSESGYSRLPVYEGSIDNITGIIYLKDFYNTAFRTKTSIEEIVKPVSFVPKSKKIADLRKELQEQQLHIAIVMDEFGCTVGLVTLEDILEELVGEIWDEHDEIVREIMQTDEHTWVVSGKANVEKVFEVLDQECAYEAMTVAGWVMEILEKIPAEGDHFEQDGLQVRVTKMYRKRIEQVEIIKAPVDASQEQEDAE